MDILPVERKAIVLDREELLRLKACFDYLYHRAEEHEDSYVAKQEKLRGFIGYMRTKLKEEF